MKLPYFAFLIFAAASGQNSGTQIKPFTSLNEKFMAENTAKLVLISHRDPEPTTKLLNSIQVESSSYKCFYLIRQKSAGPGLLEELSIVILSRKTHFVCNVTPDGDIASARKWCDRHEAQISEMEKIWFKKTKK